VTTMAAMFFNCESLENIASMTTTNTNSVTNFLQMFQGCASMTVAPAITMPAASSTQGMFSDCLNLTTVPLYDLNGVTSATSMFSNCPNLSQVPAFDMSTVTNPGSFLTGCSSLQDVPAWNLSAATTLGSIFSPCVSLSKVLATGMNATMSVANCNLSGTALDQIYTNLSATGAGKTITVTNNWGTATDNPAIATAKGWTVTG